MLKRGLTFFIIQIIAVLLSLLVLGFALAGSHGRLYFSNGGGTVALIITIILALPLLYLFIQRHKLQNKKLSFITSIFLFVLGLTAIYIGLPNMTKQFIIDKSNINNVSIYNDNDLTIDFKLEEEMFERVSIDANITKTSSVELTKLNLTIYNSKGEIVKPVFRPIAWDSLHHETIQMDSFFETNKYTRLNQFGLTGEYSIENTDSLKMQVDYTFTKNGETISENKKFEISIGHHLVLEKLIEY